MTDYFTPVPIAQLTSAHVTETLYRTHAGDYWLTGSGDADSHWGGHKGTQPLSATWAMAWIHQHEHEPGYVQLFDYGDGELKQKRMISANLKATTYRKLQALAVTHNCTKTDILEDLINREWASEYPYSVYEPGYSRPLQDVVSSEKGQAEDKPEKSEKDYNLTVSGTNE